MSPQTQTLRMLAGTHHLVPVRRGSRLLISSGEVYLKPPPVWLAETPVTEQRRLGAEEYYLVTADGWLSIVARTAAELRLLPPATQHVGSRWQQWLTLVLRRLPSPG